MHGTRHALGGMRPVQYATGSGKELESADAASCVDHWVIIKIHHNPARLVGTTRTAMLHRGGKDYESIRDAAYTLTAFKVRVAIICIDIKDGSIGVLERIIVMHFMFYDSIGPHDQIRFDTHR